MAKIVISKPWAVSFMGWDRVVLEPGVHELPDHIAEMAIVDGAGRVSDDLPAHQSDAKAKKPKSFKAED